MVGWTGLLIASQAGAVAGPSSGDDRTAAADTISPDTLAGDVDRRLSDRQQATGRDGPWRGAEVDERAFSQAYQPPAETTLEMTHAGAPGVCRRTLDLDSALASVANQVDGIGFTRETFAAQPDSIVAIRPTADRADALACRIALGGGYGSETA